MVCRMHDGLPAKQRHGWAAPALCCSAVVVVLLQTEQQQSRLAEML